MVVWVRRRAEFLVPRDTKSAAVSVGLVVVLFLYWWSSGSLPTSITGWLGWALISFFAVSIGHACYKQATEATKLRDAIMLPLILGGIMFIGSGSPTCLEYEQGTTGGTCLEYADDGYDASLDDRLAAFARIFLYFGVPAFFGFEESERRRADASLARVMSDA